MPRYIVNLRSKIYHDTFDLTERCNTDDTSFAVVRVDDLADAALGTAVYRPCKHEVKLKQKQQEAQG